MYLSKDDPDFWGQGPEWSADARELGAAVGIKLRHFVMADSDERPEEGQVKPPVAALMYQPPGFCLPRHSHASHRLEFIVQGSLEADGRVLGPGDVMWSPAGEVYGPHVAGPEGVLTVEIFSTTDGVGGQMVDPDVDAKGMLARLRSGDMTPEEREQEIREYAARIHSHGAAEASEAPAGSAPSKA